MKKSILTLAFLIASACPASATEMTVPSFTIPNYSRTTAPKVRVYYSTTFTASDGTVVVGGTPSGGIAYKVVTTTLLGGTITVPAFTIQSTTDGVDFRTSRASFWLYDGNSQISPNPLAPYAGLVIPPEMASATGCSPTGTCASLAEFKNYNQTAPSLPPVTYYTAAQVNALIVASGNVTSLTAGSSGSDFNIAGTTPSFTINLPAAGATASGKVTTGTQTFAGAKTFSSAVAFSAGLTSTTGVFSGAITVASCTGCGGGTVSSVSVVTANGISGSVATATTTPAITLTLGAITPTTVNGNTLTTGTWTLTGGAAKTLTFSNSLTLAGTDGTTITFPSTSASMARIDAGQTFTGVNTMTSPVFITPSLGAATATSVNGLTVTSTSSATLTIPASASLIRSGAHSLTLTTTGASNVTFPASGTLLTTAVTSLPSLSTVGNITTGSLAGGATLGAVTMDVAGADATGDMYYRNAAGSLTRIAAGALGTFLSMGGFSVPFWSASAAIPAGSTGELQWNNAGAFDGAANSAVTASGDVAIAPDVHTSGVQTAFKVTTAADTTLTASTEAIGVDFDTDAIREHATGALTTQREVLFRAPTYSFVAASVITNAATVAISGAPVAGTNATITNSNAFWVQGGTSKFVGPVTVDAAFNSCQDAGASDTYACSLVSPPSAYATAQVFWFKANTANTGAATLNLNSLGAKTIKKVAGGITSDLADNDIQAGQWVHVVYDGTNMQMISLLGNAAAAGGSPGGSNTQVQYNNSSAFGGITGVLSNGTNLTISTALNSCQDAGASDAYACSLAPSPGAYATGQIFWFKANTANTGAATIDFNSLGAKTIVKVTAGITTALDTNDIRAGQWISVQYDGTNMQMQSMLGNAATGVSGSGTTGTIPKWASSSSLGDSVILEGSGLIGIGAASAAARLFVKGTADVDSYIRIDDSAAAVQMLIGTRNTSPIGFMGTLSAHSVEIRANNTGYITIDASGNVFLNTTKLAIGNGTTAVTPKLYVKGTSNSDSFLRVDDAAGTIQAIYGTTTVGTEGFAGTLSNHDFSLRSNNTTRVTLDTTGRFIFATVAFASLGTPADGAFTYCNDCTVTSGADNTCAGSGTGAIAARLNGAWRCFNAQN